MLLALRIIITAITIVAIIIALFLLLTGALVNLTDFYTGVAVFLVGAGIAIGYWGIKPHLEKRIERTGEKSFVENSINPEPITSSNLNILFDSEQPDTHTPARSYRTRVIGETIYKKFMRVKIENKGNAIAKRCDAKLQVLTDNKDGTNPSTDSKPLPWDSGGLYTYIGVNNDAMLDVIFSNSREVVDSKANSLRKVAFISTRESKNPRNIYFPRIEDGFNIGDYKVRLTIRDESGASAEAFFVIHVTKEWDKISMERIQSS